MTTKKWKSLTKNLPLKSKKDTQLLAIIPASKETKQKLNLPDDWKYEVRQVNREIKCDCMWGITRKQTDKLCKHAQRFSEFIKLLDERRRN